MTTLELHMEACECTHSAQTHVQMHTQARAHMHHTYKHVHKCGMDMHVHTKLHTYLGFLWWKTIF